MEASWDRIQHTCDLHELSDKFFDNLFRTLPELQSMFTKPKKMQFIMFAKALDLLVRSVSDAKVMDIDVKAIAMRHIKFDIRSEHLDMFGQILLQTLGDAAGPGNWDENDAAAWQDIYSHVAGVFGHVISTGRNLVSKALATGDVEQLRTALGVASRRRRVLAALEIDVDDSVISPLVWSIQEGQLQVANAILEDVLAIRGDRDNYYYGRSVLWNRHPWIVQLLVEKAPNLLSTFLDGHMWTSRFLENGHRRVNYYIQELYGDPRASQNAKMVFTPLGVLVRRLPDAQIYIFAHPTIQFVVDLKWEQFAKQRFVIEQSANLATLVLGMAFMQMGVDRPGVTFGLATAQVAIACIRMALVLWKSLRLLLNGTTPKWNLGGLKLPVPHFLADAFIFFNFVSCAMVTAFYFVTMDVDPFNWKLVLQGSSHQSDEEWIATHDGKKLEAWSTLAAFTTGLLWLQMVEAFKLTTKLSALLFSLTAVISDVLRFILVLGVWAAGFSLIIYWLFVGGNLRDGAEIHDALHVDLGVEGYSDAGTLVFYVVMSCLGLTGIQFIMEASWIIRAVYALCVITTVIVILNLLVSTMVSTYESLNRSFHELAVKTRAEIVVRAEAGLSFPRRCKYFDQCKFNEKVPFDEADDGPSGGVQVVLSAREMGHKAFRVLDRVERYAGSSDPESPWKQDDMLSGAVATGDIHGGNGAGSTSNNRVLRAIDTELSRLGSEIYTLKSSLIKQDDDASSAGKSSALEGDEDGAAKEHAEAEHTSTRDDAADGASKVGSDRNHEEADEQPSPGKLRIVQYAELRAHSSEASFWMVIDGIVRDATSLLGYHPGGKEVLLQQAGMDASAAFHEAHKGPSRTIASAMLKNIPAVGRLQSLESAVPLPGAVGSFQPAPSRPAVPPIPGFHEALKLQGAATSVTSILRSGDGPLTGIMHTSRDVALDF